LRSSVWFTPPVTTITCRCKASTTVVMHTCERAWVLSFAACRTYHLPR
jgi:hypothetical protein